MRQRIPAVADDTNRKATLNQRLGDQLRGFQVVFDIQYLGASGAHRRSRSSGPLAAEHSIVRCYESVKISPGPGITPHARTTLSAIAYETTALDPGPTVVGILVPVRTPHRRGSVGSCRLAAVQRGLCADPRALATQLPRAGGSQQQHF